MSEGLAALSKLIFKVEPHHVSWKTTPVSCNSLDADGNIGGTRLSGNSSHQGWFNMLEQHNFFLSNNSCALHDTDHPTKSTSSFNFKIFPTKISIYFSSNKKSREAVQFSMRSNSMPPLRKLPWPCACVIRVFETALPKVRHNLYGTRRSASRWYGYSSTNEGASLWSNSFPILSMWAATKTQSSIGRWHSRPDSGRRGCFFGICTLCVKEVGFFPGSKKSSTGSSRGCSRWWGVTIAVTCSES